MQQSILNALLESRAKQPFCALASGPNQGRNSKLPISVLTPMPALALVLRDKISPKVSLRVGLTDESGEVF